MVPILRVNILGEPPDEQGMLENAPVGPVPGDRVVRIVGDEDEPKILDPFLQLQFIEWGFLPSLHIFQGSPFKIHGIVSLDKDHLPIPRKMARIPVIF